MMQEVVGASFSQTTASVAFSWAADPKTDRLFYGDPFLGIAIEVHQLS
jgi:hypothetical protein